MPTLNLRGGKSAPTRSKPASARKGTASKSTPTRNKPATRKQAPARNKQAEAQTNGAQTRGPKLPEGWSKRDFESLVKRMEKAASNKQDAAAKLAEAQEAVNTLALDAIAEGIQMSIVVDHLNLSRQWLYKIMEDAGVKTERQATSPHPNKGKSGNQAKPAARKPAAKKAAAGNGAAKRSPARNKPAAKKPAARKPPARKGASGRGRVSLTRR